jgi:hypothetical protein
MAIRFRVLNQWLEYASSGKYSRMQPVTIKMKVLKDVS